MRRANRRFSAPDCRHDRAAPGCDFAAAGPTADPAPAAAAARPLGPLERRGSWVARLCSASLASRLGFLDTPADEMVRGLARRSLHGCSESPADGKRRPLPIVAWAPPNQDPIAASPRGSAAPSCRLRRFSEV